MAGLASIADLATRHDRLTAILLGALAATGFAPLGLWPLTLACIAGLIWLFERAVTSSPPITKNGWKNVFLLGWSFGLGHFTVGNNWIAHAFVYQEAMPHWLGYFAVVALALYLAIYPGFALLGLYLARRRWPALTPLPLFAALWVVTEYGRATIFTGFAWDPLGMIWLGTGVDQVARVIGTYGLSALAILGGGALLAAVRREWRSAAIVILPLAVLAGIGLARTAEPTPHSGVRIAVVQPNIGQVEKYDPSLEQQNFAKLARLTGTSRPGEPRLIFWPEAAIEAWLDMEPEWLERVSALERPGDLLLTGGAKVYFKERGKGFYTDRTLVGANNSAWVVTPDGRLIARYDKAHLVPYGEYLPMRNILEPLGLSRLVPGDADFWPGPGPRSLHLPPAPSRPSLKMGVQICYEIIFSGQVVHAENRPDFLYNPSNDAWFGSWGPPQHLAQARMRAIEEAMPVIRSTPTGISAVVDAHGRLDAAIPLHQGGVINGFLPSPAAATLFSRFGNLLPMAFAFLLIALACIPLARRSASR